MYWNSFPDTIAIHFDAEGKPNGFAEKATGLLLIPGMNIGIYLLMVALPFIDPLKSNYNLFRDKFLVIRMSIHAFLAFMFFVIALFALGYQFNMMLIVFYGVLVLLMVLGNNMGSVRPNYFIGVRTPWTLADAENWRKTHRLTAKLWVYASIFMMVVLQFFSNPVFPFMIFAIVIILIPVAYSYFLFKKNPSSESKVHN
jgi:uncharacterized membrane protein